MMLRGPYWSVRGDVLDLKMKDLRSLGWASSWLATGLFMDIHVGLGQINHASWGEAEECTLVLTAQLSTSNNYGPWWKLTELRGNYQDQNPGPLYNRQ